MGLSKDSFSKFLIGNRFQCNYASSVLKFASKAFWRKRSKRKQTNSRPKMSKSEHKFRNENIKHNLLPDAKNTSCEKWKLGKTKLANAFTLIFPMNGFTRKWKLTAPMVRKFPRPIKCLEQLELMTKNVGRTIGWVCIRYDDNKSLEHAGPLPQGEVIRWRKLVVIRKFCFRYTIKTKNSP